MLNSRLQRRLPEWELPEELDFAHAAADVLPSQELPFDLRNTLQLDVAQLFVTSRLEERLPALDWSEVPGFNCA